MQHSGLIEFIEELESHCYDLAIATFVGKEGKPFVVDLKRRGNLVIYSEPRNLFTTRILNSSKPQGSLVLRSFTPEIDELTHLPIKELRGYFLKSQGDELEFEKLSPTVMFACQNTDAETGEPLSLEQSVRYC